MPVIAKFNGIVIKMYYIDDEHEPPHIHVQYGEFEGVIAIRTGKLLHGKLPKKTLRFVLKFVSIYSKLLSEMWNKQIFERINYMG